MVEGLGVCLGVLGVLCRDCWISWISWGKAGRHVRGQGQGRKIELSVRMEDGSVEEKRR